MALVLKVSRSGFYHWLKFGEVVSKRAWQQQLRDEQIQQIFVDSKPGYGATRIQVELEDNQQTACIKTISDSMKRQGLAATATNQKWITDITYLWTSEGWLYLAVIIDLFSRAVMVPT